MKSLLILLSLGAAISAAEDMTPEGWAKSKVLQNCYGEEAMSRYEEMKMAATAKCHGMEPPETLNGPLFQSPLSIVQRILESGLSQGPNGMTDFNGGLLGMIEEMLGDNMMGMDGPMMMEPRSDNAHMDVQLSVPSKVLLKGLSMLKGGKMGRRGPPKHMRDDWDPFMDDYRGGGWSSEEMMAPSYRRYPEDRFGSSKRMRGGDWDPFMDGYREGPGGGRSSEEMMGPPYRRYPEDRIGQSFQMCDLLSPDNQAAINELMKAIAAMGAAKNRTKRATDPDEMKDLEDAFKAKLEKLQMKMMAEIGNMTCVMQELKYVDAEGNIDLEGKLAIIDVMGIRDQWLADKARMVARSCYDSAMAVPKEYHSLFNIDEKSGRISMFVDCNEKAAMEVCMNLDAKKQLEKNFGSISKLVEDTGMDEGSLLFLARQIFSANGKIYAPLSSQEPPELDGAETEDIVE